jgi:hypothetical protein
MSAQSEGPECQQSHAVKKDDHYVQFHKPKPNYTLIFHNEDNMQIGKFDFNGEGLEFEGNATESAILFINWIAEAFKGRLEAEYQRGFEEGKKHETNT